AAGALKCAPAERLRVLVRRATKFASTNSYATQLDQNSRSPGLKRQLYPASASIASIPTTEHGTERALAFPHDRGRGDRQIDYRRRIDAAITTVQHRIDLVLEPRLDLDASGHRLWLVRQQ